MRIAVWIHLVSILVTIIDFILTMGVFDLDWHLASNIFLYSIILENIKYLVNNYIARFGLI